MADENTLDIEPLPGPICQTSPVVELWSFGWLVYCKTKGCGVEWGHQFPLKADAVAYWNEQVEKGEFADWRKVDVDEALRAANA